METSENLPTIQKVDLRKMWPHEARDFTPWLAEYLSKLGNALGLRLKLKRQEASVGDYSLDILAHDVKNDKPVVIENQLESTDHDHLGKLLTYAAEFDARVMIWIAKEFRDEHKEALKLLNRCTEEDRRFFGVEVELLKIDDSRPAPHFNPVANPQKWRKPTGSKARETVKRKISEQRERYQTFFQKLMDTLREEHDFTKARKAQPQNWQTFSAGHAQRVQYGANFAQGRRARVEVYIGNTDRDWNKDLFDKLLGDKESMESKLQESLEWDRLDNRRASRIAVTRPGSIDDTQETLEEIRNWMVQKLLNFKRVFGPRLDELAR